MDETELDPFALERCGASSESAAAAANQFLDVGPDMFVAACKAFVVIAIHGYPRAIRSTFARRNELLRRHKGDGKSAAEEVAAEDPGWEEEVKERLLRLIPYFGFPTSMAYPLWKHLRKSLLIAGLFGHNVLDEVIQAAVIYAVAGMQSVPKTEETLEKAAQALWKKVARGASKFVPVGSIVLGLVDLDSHVMANILQAFRNGPGVPEPVYLEGLDPEPTQADLVALLKDIGSQTYAQVLETIRSIRSRA